MPILPTLVGDSPEVVVPTLMPPRLERAQLHRVRKLIEEGAVSVLSLDMFDTIVWRKVPRPTDAFIILGEGLLRDGLLGPGIDAYTFRRLRIKAEAMARLDKRHIGGGDEVSLDEIWGVFPDHLLRTDRQTLVGREIEVERQVTVPDLDIADLARFAAANDVQLVVVSNTYLTRQQLAKVLARPELRELSAARIFPSSAYGVNKSDGLWPIVLDELGVAPASIVHVGDEQLSDVDIPIKHGIRVAPFYRLYGGSVEPLQREGALIPDPASPSGQIVDPNAGDFGITGIRNKVVARGSGDELPGDLGVAWRYGAAVMGPVLTGFAEWVNTMASDLGATKVWCLMREGELLAELVNAVTRERPNRIEAKPLWLSRHVTGRPATSVITEPYLRSLAVRRVPPTVGQYLDNLGLEPGETPELNHLINRAMDDEVVLSQVIDTVMMSGQLRARVLENAAGARARLINYLEKATGGLTSPLVLVDLGWGGTIQSQIQKVFALAGIDVRVVGLYLSTNEGACGRVLDGNEMYGWLTSCGVPEFQVHQISRSPEVVEQICTSSTGTVLDFDDSGQPILASAVPPPGQVVQKVLVQHGIRAFQHEWLRYDRQFYDWPKLDRASPQLLRILEKSITEPTADEARVFGAWDHDDNFGTEHSETVIPQDLGALTPYLTPADVIEMTTQDAYWPMGLISQFDPVLTTSTKAVLTGAIPMTVFEPERAPINASLRLDSGAGFGNATVRRVRINRNGLSHLHFNVSQPGVVAARLELSEGPALVRVDWIDLDLRIGGHTETKRIRLGGESSLASLGYPNSRWLYDGVFMCLGGPAAIDIPIQALSGASASAVSLRFAGAVTALPTPSRPVGLGPDGSALLTLMAKARTEASSKGMGAVVKGGARVLRRTLRG